MIRLILCIELFCFAATLSAKAPNFIMFITDDQGVYHSNPYGASEMRTPHMQALADDGLRFTRAYVASPSCAPSRSALFSGLMPHNNGVVGNHENLTKEGVASLLPLISGIGYEIAWYGKVGHGAAWYASHPSITRIPYSEKASKNSARRLDMGDVENFLRNRKEASRPLALFVGSRWPHRPWPEPGTTRIPFEDIALPPKTFDTPEARSEMARYIESVERADHKLGALRILVREYLGEDNTLLLFTADHGQAWPFGKWTLYETGIRTPLIVVWPGRIQPNKTTRAMVSWIDIIPTFIDLAGGDIPWEIDGRSFKAVLLGETNRHREEIYAVQKGDKAMSVYPIRSVRSEKYKYIRNLYPEFLFTTHMDHVREDSPYWNRNWQSWVDAAKSDPEAAAFLRAYHSRPPEELYLVESDPFEKTNLAHDPGFEKVLKAMREKVLRRMEEVGDDRSLSGEPRFLKDHPLP